MIFMLQRIDLTVFFILASRYSLQGSSNKRTTKVTSTAAKVTEHKDFSPNKHLTRSKSKQTASSMPGADLGEGPEEAAAPPFVGVWDFLGQCPRMVHDPTDSRRRNGHQKM